MRVFWSTKSAWNSVHQCRGRFGDNFNILKLNEMDFVNHCSFLHILHVQICSTWVIRNQVPLQFYFPVNPCILTASETNKNWWVFTKVQQNVADMMKVQPITGYRTNKKYSATKKKIKIWKDFIRQKYFLMQYLTSSI